MQLGTELDQLDFNSALEATEYRLCLDMNQQQACRLRNACMGDPSVFFADESQMTYHHQCNILKSMNDIDPQVKGLIAFPVKPGNSQMCTGRVPGSIDLVYPSRYDTKRINSGLSGDLRFLEKSSPVILKQSGTFCGFLPGVPHVIENEHTVSHSCKTFRAQIWSFFT